MPSDWKQSSLDRRDFRHTHDAPEIPPHRRKKKGSDRSKCEHEFKMTDSKRYGIGDREWGYDNYLCSKCGKRRVHWFDPKR
jgi:hypothetical protein